MPSSDDHLAPDPPRSAPRPRRKPRWRSRWRPWREPVNVHLLPVLPPGSRKSAVIGAATRPLYAAEEALAESVRSQAGDAIIERDIAVKAAEKARKDATDQAERVKLTAAAVSAVKMAEDIEVLPIPRLIADDITPEAVGSLLAEQGGRLAVISAEGGIFDAIGGRYSNGIPSLDVWLKGHSGDPVRVDCKGRPSEHVRNPALTVQPTVLAAWRATAPSAAAA